MFSHSVVSACVVVVWGKRDCVCVCVCLYPYEDPIIDFCLHGDVNECKSCSRVGLSNGFVRFDLVEVFWLFWFVQSVVLQCGIKIKLYA